MEKQPKEYPCEVDINGAWVKGKCHQMSDMNWLVTVLWKDTPEQVRKDLTTTTIWKDTPQGLKEVKHHEAVDFEWFNVTVQHAVRHRYIKIAT